ncbi:hypothetical protein OAF16_03220 [Flavobacteriales bacterium]|nr:hypothetical protein [Flavobacteriales bacterium]
MKKTIIYLFSVLVISSGISSCKKTNANKISGDWTISNFTETSTSSSGSETVTIDGNVISIDDGSSVTTGNVTSAAMSFDKEGTWTQSIGYSVDYSGTGFTAIITYTMENSGTWSFVGKNKSAELKANDRIVLSTLSTTTTDVTAYTIAGVTTEDTNTSMDTYNEGEETQTLLVESSSKSEFVCSANESNTSTYNGSSTTNSTISSWTLTK